MTKAVETAVKALVEKAVDVFRKKVVNKIVLACNVNIPHLSSHFKRYLKRTYQKYDSANTLAFPNQGRCLRDIYAPLTLVREGIKKDGEKFEYKIDQYPDDLFSARKKVLIRDTAGMGKSTVLKFLFLEAVDKEKGIPFIIELRNLSRKHSVLNEIRQQLKSLTKEFAEDLLLELLNNREGNFIFLFDGYDEIAESERAAVTADLRSFIEQVGDNTFVLTSRADFALPSFGEFASYRIRPLDVEESYQLLRKYDSNGETSAKLVEKLKSEKDDRISVFLQNPLLTSLLFIGYNYTPEIPMEVHLFYYQVYEALFNKHDQSKDGTYVHEKRSGYTCDEFACFLRAFAYVCFTKTGQPSFSKADFGSYVKEAKVLAGLRKGKIEALQHDLLQAVPLMQVEGQWVRWVHKSFMEYFAADYIHRYLLKKENYVRDLAAKKDVSNSIGLLDFFADLDEQTFKVSVLVPVLREFVKFIDRPIKSVKKVTREQEQRIRRRRQFLFHRQTYFYFYDFKPAWAGWDALGKAIEDVKPPGSGPAWYQSLGGGLAMITMSVNESRFELVQLVLRKYPQLKERNRPAKHSYRFQIPCYKRIPYTEDLMLSYPDNYDLLDYVNIHSDDSKDQSFFLNYGEAKKMLGEMGISQK